MEFLIILLVIGIAWLWVAMIGPLFYAIEGNVVAKWGAAGLDAVQATFLAMVIGIVIVSPLVIVSGQFIDPSRLWGPPEHTLVLMSALHALLYAGYVWLAKHAGRSLRHRALMSSPYRAWAGRC